MSRADILSLAEAGLFRPRSRPWELHALHVPFDTLTGTDRFERRAITRLTQGTCVAVIGASGAGKSSVIAWVCDQLPLTHIALRIPITGVADPGDVGEVAQLALSTTLNEIALGASDQDTIESARANQASTTTTPMSASAALGGGPIPASVTLNTASLQQEYTSDRLGGDYLLALNSRLVPILVQAGLIPVFVFEDTEATVGGTDSNERAEAFFAGPLSAFVDQVDAPTLVAIQDNLIAKSEAFARLAPTIDRLEVPLVKDRSETVVDSILSRRLTQAGFELSVSDVFARPGVELLASFYEQTGGDLRRVLAATYDATDHASLDQASLVDEPHVRFGIEQWRPR